jgi:methylamine--corrinoid protein Co-methyltransferase
LEARLMGEVGKAVSRQGGTLEQANQWVLELLEKYEHIFKLPGGNPGVRFDQAYNLETLQPVPAWAGMYENTVEMLCGMGLKLSAS